MKAIAFAAAVAAVWAGSAEAVPAPGVVAVGQGGALFREDDAPLSILGAVTFAWGGRFAVGAGAGYERFPHEIDYAYPKYHVPAFARLNVRFSDRLYIPSLNVDAGAAFTTTGWFYRGNGEYRYSSAVNPLVNVGARFEIPVRGRLIFLAEPSLRLESMVGYDYDVFVFGAAYFGLGFGAG